jgi:hypothetical protein
VHEITEDGLKLEVEVGEDAPDASENADGWVTLPDGTKWSATFLTYAELGRVMDRWKVTGECLNGSYFTCPDLVLSRSPGFRACFQRVRDMVANGDHELSLRQIE